MEDKIVQSVVDKYQQRSRVGQGRSDLNFAEWLMHLQEELMDAALYIAKLKSELESSPAFPDGHIITKESWDNADKLTINGFVYVKFTDLKLYK